MTTPFHWIVLAAGMLLGAERPLVMPHFSPDSCEKLLDELGLSDEQRDAARALYEPYSERIRAVQNEVDEEAQRFRNELALEMAPELSPDYDISDLDRLQKHLIEQRREYLSRGLSPFSGDQGIEYSRELRRHSIGVQDHVFGAERSERLAFRTGLLEMLAEEQVAVFERAWIRAEITAHETQYMGDEFPARQRHQPTFRVDVLSLIEDACQADGELGLLGGIGAPGRGWSLDDEDTAAMVALEATYHGAIGIFEQQYDRMALRGKILRLEGDMEAAEAIEKVYRQSRDEVLEAREDLIEFVARVAADRGAAEAGAALVLAYRSEVCGPLYVSDSVDAAAHWLETASLSEETQAVCARILAEYRTAREPLRDECYEFELEDFGSIFRGAESPWKARIDAVNERRQALADQTIHRLAGQLDVSQGAAMRKVVAEARKQTSAEFIP